MRGMHSDFEGDGAETEVSFEALFNEESPFDLEADDEFDPDYEATQDELDLERTRGRMRRPRSRGTRTQRRRRSSGIRRPLLSRPRPQRIVRPASRVPSCVCPAHGTEFIRWVQSALNRIFSMSQPVDGVMSRATRDALRRFQQQHGLPADGIAGPDTERAMLEARDSGHRDGAAGTAKSMDAKEDVGDMELSEYDAEEIGAALQPSSTSPHTENPFTFEIEEFETECPNTESDTTKDEFGTNFDEFEASSKQKNWYYYDAWWRSENGTYRRLEEHGPLSATKANAKLFYQDMCRQLIRSTSGQSDGKVVTRCWVWLPVSQKWSSCRRTSTNAGGSFDSGGTCSDITPESEMSALGLTELELESSPSVSPSRTTFRLDCPAGCAPFPAAQCRVILRRAVLDAIALADNAASKLTTAPRDKDTVRLFRFFFGHNPSRSVPWANNRESGVIVAQRFRKSALELGGGRRIQYRCGCPGAGPTVRARTINGTEVLLCPRFWGASPQAGLSARFFRAGVILHEMLHQLFIEFIRHNPNERRRNNAHCYEAFAMRVAGHAADRSDVRQCRDRPT